MLGQALRQAIFVLGQDVASMISITGELMSFQNRLLHMASNAAGFAAAIATRLAVHGLNQDGGNLARWTSVAHELKAVDKEFKRFVKPM
jgi:hypothetical protein